MLHTCATADDTAGLPYLQSLLHQLPCLLQAAALQAPDTVFLESQVQKRLPQCWPTEQTWPKQHAHEALVYSSVQDSTADSRLHQAARNDVPEGLLQEGRLYESRGLQAVVTAG